MEFQSKTIYFRFAEQNDSKFIHSLRINKNYNKHLSKVEGGYELQKKWIIDYKKRELEKKEYYFIICRKLDSLPIGTVRIYDFIEEENSFCWGSWILNENKTRYSALESAILIYDFAFFELGFKRCHMNIRKENLKVINFHKKFGVKIIGEDDLDLLGHFYIEDYLIVRDDIIKIIQNS